MAESVDGGGFWRDTWRALRRRPQFVISAALIGFVVLVAVVPSLFTAADPGYADPDQSLLGTSAAHWFGTDLQGHDIYARTIYGARASVLVGLCTTVFTLVVGTLMGLIAAYYGGWVDAVLQRLGDIFFAFPLLYASAFSGFYLPLMMVLWL